MRVAIVRQRYNPYGGAERFIASALPALERAGAEVTLIARRADGWGARRFLGVDPFYVGNAWRDASFARAAKRAWEAGKFDLVQSHERIPGCEIYRAGDGVHVRWLEIRRAAAGPIERLGIALGPYHHYVCAAERGMFEHPRLRAVICNSNMVRDEIRQAFRVSPERLHVIYNGVDLDFFHPGRREHLREATRDELGVAPLQFVFLFVGSGFARKGLDSAIGALALCKDEAFCLVVAGRDSHSGRYAAQARAAGVGERVRFLGGREDVSALYAAVECFILPTRYDPFPNTVLEALAMGVPAIVGRQSGAAEIVRHGENGWLCEPEDVAALALLMREAARKIGPGMRELARASAESYGIDDMARKLTQLYATLV